MTRLDSGHFSLRLRERMLEALARAFAPVAEIRARIHGGDADLLSRVTSAMPELLEVEARALQGELSEDDRAALQSVLQSVFCNSLYRNRLIQTVLEEIYSERISPPLQIQIEPWHPPTQTRQLSIHAVIFQHGACIGNELYPLMIDAYEHNCRTGQSRLVLGVHVDWLTPEGSAARALVLDVENDALIEAPMTPPLTLDSVQFLAISVKSRSIISRRLAVRSIIQVNPFSVCDAMDDKFTCWERWRDANVPTPPARIVPRGAAMDPEGVRNLIESLRGEEGIGVGYAVIQPNRGTEGRETSAFSDDDSAMTEHIARIAQYDDVLIRGAVASVEMKHPSTDEYGYFDLRLNVTDGLAESGFFQVAQPGSVIASPSQGGRIVEWRRGEPFCWRVEGGAEQGELDQSAWRVLRETAESAASVFPECRLVGVDVRLDRAKDAWRAWALDINPCPAGMMHACYLDGNEQGVTRRLWRWLDAMHDAIHR